MASIMVESQETVEALAALIQGRDPLGEIGKRDIRISVKSNSYVCYVLAIRMFFLLCCSCLFYFISFLRLGLNIKRKPVIMKIHLF